VSKLSFYRGRRGPDGRPIVEKVWTDGTRRPLRVRLDLRSHSPDGFEWGYGGSGPSQLALALLADCAGDAAAMRRYQDFKREYVSQWPEKGWTIAHEEVTAWVCGLR
jgi:Family of unknown function (DUF6166)